MGLMFPKPPKRKKRSKHITNKRITEYIPCDYCHSRPATETHEVFGGSNRNKSIKAKAQLRLCHHCHELMTLNKIDVLPIKQEYQKKIMKEMDLSKEEWIKIYGKSYI